MTVDTLPAEALHTAADTPVAAVASFEPTITASTEQKPNNTPAKRSTRKSAKTLELTLTVTGTADGDWRADLKQGPTYLARDIAIAAAAVSRAAKELHWDLAAPIDAAIEEARSQQAAKVAALEAELDAARKALADLD